MRDTTASAGTGSVIKKKLKALWADSRSYLQRLQLAAIAMLAACFTFIFFGPLEMVAFGGNAMSYGYQDVIWILAIAALAVFATGSLLIACLKGKLFNYAVTLVFAVTVCGYLQAAMMNGDLGLLNGDAIYWQGLAVSMLGNLLVWAAVSLVLFFVLYLNRGLWKKLVIFVCALLVVMQLASTVSILLSDTEDNITVQNLSLTDRGMYEYSSEENIFVFVLDRLDYDYIERVLKEDPAFFDKLDGFTGYTNAISAYARTQPALNQILTGSESAFSCSSEQFYADSWQEDGKDILQELNEQNYSVEIYSNLKYLFSDAEYALDHVSNVSEPANLRPFTLLSRLIQLSVYRYAPIAIKPFFWEDTNFYNFDVFEKNTDSVYQFNDSGYAPGFLTAAADRTQSSFKFYHFFGPHAPYTMNADGTASSEPTTVTEQTMGSFNNLFAAFDRMKELGIYEDATIIITADHGSAIDDKLPVQKATRIGLFYKPSGSAGTPLVLSAAQVCTDNVSATIMKAAGVADYTRYGLALDDIAEDQDVERYYFKTAADPKTGTEHTLYKYIVTGDAADFDNWHLVETVAIGDEENSFY